ncbi:MAG: hypothetical protein QM635_00275 [Microbacteriaceae bacterium]
MSAAWRSAERAADAAHVTVRMLRDVDELLAAERVQQQIWRVPSDRALPVTASVMRALQHSGNYCAGVWDADAEELIGVAIGFFGAPGYAALHSHVAGVLPARVHAGAGRALKLHERAWALERGITQMTWTYDPLIGRNAWFNLGKLGAVAEDYLVDFYGPMADEVNLGDTTDRLLVRWRLDDEATESLAAGGPVRLPAEPEGILLAEAAGRPQPQPPDPWARTLGVAVPDSPELRDLGLTRLWREAVRAALAPRLGHGWHIAGFRRGTGYVISTDR